MTQSISGPVPEPRKPKLLDQVRHRCRLRHLALSTEHAYVGWSRRFVLLHHKRHPLEMGANEVSAFLTHLAVARRVAAVSNIVPIPAQPPQRRADTPMRFRECEARCSAPAAGRPILGLESGVGRGVG